MDIHNSKGANNRKKERTFCFFNFSLKGIFPPFRAIERGLDLLLGATGETFSHKDSMEKEYSSLIT